MKNFALTVMSVTSFLMYVLLAFLPSDAHPQVWWVQRLVLGVFLLTGVVGMGAIVIVNAIKEKD